jgi:hypothetical protein
MFLGPKRVTQTFGSPFHLPYAHTSRIFHLGVVWIPTFDLVFEETMQTQENSRIFALVPSKPEYFSSLVREKNF